MSPRGLAFELLRFEATPVGSHVVLLELEGRLAGRTAAPQGLRLVVERPGERRLELPAVTHEVHSGALVASFAAPATVLRDARLALDVGGVLLDLPAPDEPDTADRTVALARELNALRRARTASDLELLEERERSARREERDAEALLAAVTERDEARAGAAEQVRTAREAEAAAGAERDATQREHEAALTAAENDCRAVITAAQEREAALVTAAQAKEAEIAAAAQEREAEIVTAAHEREGALVDAVRSAEARDDAAAVPRGSDRLPATDVAPPRERAPAPRADDAATVAEPDADATVRMPRDAPTTPPAEEDADDEPDDDSFGPDDTGPVPLRRGPRPGTTPTSVSRPARAASRSAAGRDGLHPIVRAAIVVTVLLITLAAIGLLL